VKKIITALILLAMAGAFAFFFKDYVDSKDPLRGIAQIKVTIDTEEIPCLLTGYDWKFYNGTTSGMPPSTPYEIAPAPCDFVGGETIKIDFSLPEKSINVMTRNWYQTNFHKAEIIDGEFTVPFEKGGYLYEVTAEFQRGWVQYYFYIKVV